MRYTVQAATVVDSHSGDACFRVFDTVGGIVVADNLSRPVADKLVEIGNAHGELALADAKAAAKPAKPMPGDDNDEDDKPGAKGKKPAPDNDADDAMDPMKKKYAMDAAHLADRSFSEQELRDLGAKGQAFKNGKGDWSYPTPTLADWNNARNAFGRSVPTDRARLKSYLVSRGNALGAPKDAIAGISGYSS